MNREEWINRAEQYFGSYVRPAVRAMVAVYLDRYTDDERGRLFTAMLESLSSRFDRPPDVADICKAMRDMPPEGGHYDGNRFIPDRTNGMRDELSPEERADAAAAATALKETIRNRRPA